VQALLSRIAVRNDLAPRALCVSAIGPTALPTTADGTPLRPGILYGIDTRALAEIAALEKRYDRDATIAVCGSAVSVQSPVPKLLWVKAHEPGSFAKMRRWFTAHAWLIHRLCGVYAVDHHSASQFVPVYDCAHGKWREDVWSELLPGVEAPALVLPGDVVGALTAEAAAATGMPTGLPVVMGTIDAWSEAYSAFADAPEAGMIMYGSTYFFIANSARFIASGRFWGTRSVRRDTFSLAGGMATGGLVLDWLAKLFSTDVKTVLERALADKIGPEALIALPYLTGERTPFADPDVRSVLFGMDLDTDADAVFRAFVLGLALAARDNLRAMHDELGGARDYVAVGGGASSAALLQLVSDVAGVTQSVPRRTIGAALGDARLAAEALGWKVAPETWNPIERVVHPSVDADAYDSMFARFKELHRTTRHLELPGGRV
jgi:xylulokinase